LILHGALDRNVDDSDIQHLLAGFQAGGNTNVQDAEFPDVDHELRQVPPGQQPSLAVALPFSPDVAGTITAFASALAS
ncbi:MAG TPA: hypothetical protein VH916_04300, partial [Dehalococcoidia bacterium]